MQVEALRHLLWDVHPEEVDPERHDAFLVARIFDDGTLEEIRQALAYYGPARIRDLEADGRLRGLSPKGRAFLRLATR